MCSSSTNVALKTKRMLAVTPTNLLRLRPYDLSDARHLVEQFDVPKYLVRPVLDVMNQINYEKARLFVKGDITLYFIYRSQSDCQIKTKKPDFISQQEPYSIITDEVGQESVYLLINKPSQPSKLLTKPVPKNCYYLIKNLVYYGYTVIESDNAQYFLLKLRQSEADEQTLFLKFDTNTEYKEIDAIVLEIQMN